MPLATVRRAMPAARPLLAHSSRVDAPDREARDRSSRRLYAGTATATVAPVKE